MLFSDNPRAADMADRCAVADLPRQLRGYLSLQKDWKISKTLLR
jgi:hypothetical protein